MKIMSTTILSLLLSGTYALASTKGGTGEELSFMATLFIGFGVMILVFQTIPAILLFSGLLKGLFSSADKKTTEALAGSSDKNS